MHVTPTLHTKAMAAGIEPAVFCCKTTALTSTLNQVCVQAETDAIKSSNKQLGCNQRDLI